MRKKIIYIIIVLVIGYTFYGITYSKYASNSIWDYYLKAKGFYFTSDNLSTTTLNNANNLWDGGIVHFNVKNNLNQEVVTLYDINYQVTCSIDGNPNLNCNLNGTNQNTVSGVLSSSFICSNTTNDGVDVSLFNQNDCESKHYNWQSQIAISDIYFNVVSNNQTEVNDVIVNITVTSTFPYNKTLSGKFILHKGITRDNLILDYKTFTDYNRLSIYNKYVSSKCVELSWDSSKLLISPDNTYTNYTVDNDNYINGIKFNISSKENLNYIFYSRDKQETYTVNEFTIIESTGC